MPDEPLELEEGQEGLSEEEQAMMAEYEAEGELPPEELEAAPKPQPEPAPQPEAIKVPLHELKEERQKRQDAERKLDLLAQRTDALLSQIQQVTAPEPDQPPNREEDPVGYLIWQNERLLEQQNYQAQTQHQTQEEQAKERAAQQFWHDYNANINQFAEQTPDYPQAAEFLVNSRRAELNALGITDQAQQDQILWQDSFQIAAMARERGQNHAEIFYNLAKQRGYAGGTPVQNQPTSAPAVPQQPQPQPQRQSMENVRKGAQAATSLSNLGGSGGELELSAEALINMSDDEFQAATQGKQWRRLHGR